MPFGNAGFSVHLTASGVMTFVCRPSSAAATPINKNRLVESIRAFIAHLSRQPSQHARMIAREADPLSQAVWKRPSRVICLSSGLAVSLHRFDKLLAAKGLRK